MRCCPGEALKQSRKAARGPHGTLRNSLIAERGEKASHYRSESAAREAAPEAWS